MIKKCFRYIFVLLMTAVAALLFYNFIGGAVCNDIKTAHIEKEYAGMPLPDKTRLVKTASFVGNTGCGNHTDIWVGMLICSELSMEEIERNFTDYLVVELPDDIEMENWTRSLSELSPLGYSECEKLFASLKEPVSGNGYFVVSQYYDAFTQADLRGH